MTRREDQGRDAKEIEVWHPSIRTTGHQAGVAVTRCPPCSGIMLLLGRAENYWHFGDQRVLRKLRNKNIQSFGSFDLLSTYFVMPSCTVNHSKVPLKRIPLLCHTSGSYPSIQDNAHYILVSIFLSSYSLLLDLN